MKRYLAEFIGTFGLVFIGTGSIIVNEQTNGSVGLVGIALAFGLIVATMIYTFEKISEAHFNPAVTISFAIDKLISKKEALIYIVFQILGAIFASFLLHILFPDNKNLGTTLPSGTILQSGIMEIITTFLLMMVIFKTKDPNQSSAIIGITIGAVITAMIFVAGPISGGSFNPARSIGPALISGNLQHLWLYLVTPTIGTVLAFFVWRVVRD